MRRWGRRVGRPHEPPPPPPPPGPSHALELGLRGLDLALPVAQPLHFRQVQVGQRQVQAVLPVVGAVAVGGPQQRGVGVDQPVGDGLVRGRVVQVRRVQQGVLHAALHKRKLRFRRQHRLQLRHVAGGHRIEGALLVVKQLRLRVHFGAEHALPAADITVRHIGRRRGVVTKVVHACGGGGGGAECGGVRNTKMRDAIRRPILQLGRVVIALLRAGSEPLGRQTLPSAGDKRNTELRVHRSQRQHNRATRSSIPAAPHRAVQMRRTDRTRPPVALPAYKPQKWVARGPTGRLTPHVRLRAVWFRTCALPRRGGHRDRVLYAVHALVPPAHVAVTAAGSLARSFERHAIWATVRALGALWPWRAHLSQPPQLRRGIPPPARPGGASAARSQFAMLALPARLRALARSTTRHIAPPPPLPLQAPCVSQPPPPPSWAASARCRLNRRSTSSRWAPRRASRGRCATRTGASTSPPPCPAQCTWVSGGGGGGGGERCGRALCSHRRGVVSVCGVVRQAPPTTSRRPAGGGHHRRPAAGVHGWSHGHSGVGVAG
jgi:hypothetical protein